MIVPMATAFTQLGEETWGEKVRRARNRRGVGLKEAAYHLSLNFQPVGINTLSRLEMETEPPTGRKRLILAAAYVAALGYDPEDFSIDVDELPAMVRHMVEDLAEEASEMPQKAALTRPVDVPDRSCVAA